MQRAYNTRKKSQPDVPLEAWEGGMQCPQSQHANRETAKFCEECGAMRVHLCVHCGHAVSPRAKFCEECGTPIMATTSDLGSVQSMQHKGEAESRLQALVFAVGGLLQGKRRVTYRTLTSAIPGG